MWVTADGRRHVVALPDPAEVLTARALATFARLIAEHDDDGLELLLDDRLIALSDTGFDADPEGVFVERAPAVGLLDGDLSTVAGLDAALAGIDPRWQVDLVFALQSLIESLHEETP